MATVPVGNKAGALLWWNTLAPAGIVPKSWNPNPPAILWSPNHTYKFTAATSSSTGTAVKDQGYGVISWDQTAPQGGGVINQSLYVQWNLASGKQNAAPAPPDPGEVTPSGPLSGVSGAINSVAGLIAAITNKTTWERVGIGAVGVVVLVFALILLFRREIPKMPVPLPV